MKKCFFLPLVCLSFYAAAQRTSGMITYTQSFSIPKEKTGDIPEGLAAFLAQSQKMEKTLYFNSTASLYEDKEMTGKEATEELTRGDMKIKVSRNRDEEKTYTDLKSKKEVSERVFMGRTFLVTGTSENRQWKFTGRQKKILDQPCMEATFSKDAGDTITVWYTPGIPVSAGPAGLSGLPGLILEANIGANLHLVAIRIEDDKAGGQKIKEPTKGKKITEEAFAKLMKEKEEELTKQYGGGKSGRTILIK